MHATAGVSAEVMLDVSADVMHTDVAIYYAMLLVKECDAGAEEMRIKLQCKCVSSGVNPISQKKCLTRLTGLASEQLGLLARQGKRQLDGCRLSN